MYPISSTALAKFQSGAMQYARITNGNTTITNANIVQGGMSINRYVATGESVSVGSCVAAELSLVLSNRDGSWNSYSFDGKEFYVEVGVYTSASTITYIPMGYFTVDEVKFDRNTVTLAALDRMVKFDDAIDLTQFTFPYTLKTLLERICTVCGVTLGTTGNFINYSYSVASMPSEAKTYRDVLRWICELSGTNGLIAYDGKFYMTWYRDISGFTITTANRTASEIDEHTYAITGVTIIKDENKYTSGTSTRPIIIQDNPLATTNIQTLASSIATYRNSFFWTPFSATVLPAPHLYPLDHCTFVKKDNTNADVYITSVTYKLNGNTTIEGTGDAKHKGRSYGLQDSTFYANNIAAGAITADKISAGAITADKIAANAITTEKIDPSVDMATNTGVAATYATKAAAASSNQRIYYRTSSSTAPTAPSSWVTSTSTANNTWSTKRMQYDATYKYLWTCIQTKTVSGTVTNSTVLLDDTTTVIDGGNIITGTVDANQIRAGAITAEKINSSVDMATNAGVASTYATKTNSVKREQRIYRKNNSTTAPTAPTSWITSTSVTSSAWTTKRMSYDSSYPYLWTCLQTETNDGTIACSTVLLDDTLTVIDGGKIITGSVAANAISVTDLSAFNATVGGWTIDSSQILKEVTIDGYVYQVCLNAPASPVAGNWAIGVRRRATNSQSWSYLSYFNYSGKLYSQNAEITGKITTSEGSIGDWTIDAYGLSKEVEESGSSYYTNIMAGRYPLSLGKNDGIYGENTRIQFDSKNAVQELVKRINNTEKFQYATISGGGLATYVREYDGSYASWESGGKATLTPTAVSFYEDETIEPSSWSYLTKDELEIYANGEGYVKITPSDIMFRNDSLKRLTPKLTQSFSTAIPANANLNTVAYLSVGQYNTASSSTAATQSNCPTARAYNMKVENPHSNTYDNESTATYVYRLRTITDIDGKIFVQSVYSGSTAGTFTFGTWKQIAVTSDITDTNVTQTATTTSAAYPLLFGASSFTQNTQVTTKTEGARISGGIFVNPNTATINARRIHSGTTSQYGRFVLGNAIANGTAGCSHGEMYVYGKGDKYARIYDKDNVLTANREYYFPNQSGYLMVDAVTTGTPTASSKVTSSAVTWTKVGKTVRISGTFYFNTTSNNGTLFTGLPAPASAMTIIVAGQDNYGSSIETLSINTSGEIEFDSVGTHTVDNNSRFAFDTTYISAN